MGGKNPKIYFFKKKDLQVRYYFDIQALSISNLQFKTDCHFFWKLSFYSVATSVPVCHQDEQQDTDCRQWSSKGRYQGSLCKLRMGTGYWFRVTRPWQHWRCWVNWRGLGQQRQWYRYRWRGLGHQWQWYRGRSARSKQRHCFASKRMSALPLLPVCHNIPTRLAWYGPGTLWRKCFGSPSALPKVLEYARPKKCVERSTLLT